MLNELYFAVLLDRAPAHWHQRVTTELNNIVTLSINGPVRNSKEYGNNIPTGFRRQFHVEKMRSRFILTEF